MTSKLIPCELLKPELVAQTFDSLVPGGRPDEDCKKLPGILPDSDRFDFVVQAQCLVNGDIHDGDAVVFRPGQRPRAGEICLVLIGGKDPGLSAST